MAEPEIAGIPTANIALGLSLVSFFTSTVLGVHVARRDRADIHVRLAQGDLYMGPRPATVGPLLQFEAANRGRRPVTLMSYGLEYADRSFSFCTPFPYAPLPKKLGEGEAYIGLMPLREVQEAVRKKSSRLTAVYFKTADSRTYRQGLWPWSPTYKLLTKQPLAPPTKNLELLDPTRPLRGI